MKPSVILDNQNSKLLIPTTAGMQFVPVSDVLYFESDNVYTNLHFKSGKKIIALSSIKCLEENICNKEFIRIHKKYLVSIHSIKLYSKSEGGYILLENNLQRPISRFRKEKFLLRLGLI